MRLGHSRAAGGWNIWRGPAVEKDTGAGRGNAPGGVITDHHADPIFGRKPHLLPAVPVAFAYFGAFQDLVVISRTGIVDRHGGFGNETIRHADVMRRSGIESKGGAEA